MYYKVYFLKYVSNLIEYVVFFMLFSAFLSFEFTKNAGLFKIPTFSSLAFYSDSSSHSSGLC